MSAILYCVATPIGNLADMTARAVTVLAAVDKIYAEDTRVSRKLLTHLGIQKSLVSLHEHNEEARVKTVLTELQAGHTLALISDAGTPLISDPGYRLVREVVAAGFQVVPVPGACALIAALSVAGLPTDRFVFEGFLPAKPAARRVALKALGVEARTLVFYESSHRIEGLLEDIDSVLGAGRELVIARELTKLFESFYRGTVAELLARIRTDADMRKGEFVVMLTGVEANTDDAAHSTLSAEHILQVLLDEALPVKQAAKIAARLTGQPKNSLYRQAMALTDLMDLSGQA